MTSGVQTEADPMLSTFHTNTRHFVHTRALYIVTAHAFKANGNCELDCSVISEGVLVDIH